MLWSPAHYTTAWDTAAKAAISAGSAALLSFNECDNAGQCNLDAGTAATYHIKYLNPYEGQIPVGAPSVTSDVSEGHGLSWLTEFLSACDTAGGCAVDFCNVHYYGPGGVDGAENFLAFLREATTTCNNKNIWVTEWAATSGDESAFISHALSQLDHNATYSFVEKYSYFYAAAGSLFDSTTALSTIGELYTQNFPLGSV